MNSAKEIKFGAILSYLTIAFYVIAGLLYTPYLIGNLGLSDYAIFSLSISIIGYFSMDFGVGAALTRLIARFRAEDREAEVKNILGITTKLYLAIDMLIFTGLCLLYYFTDKIFISLTPEEFERFKFVLIIISFFIIFSFPMMPLNGIFLAYEKMVALQCFELLSKLISVSLLVVSLYLGLGLFGVVIVSCGVTCSFQIAKLLYLHRRLGLTLNMGYRDRNMLKSIASFSIWATIATIADKFFFAIVPFLLASFSGTTEIAIFAIIATIEGYVLTIARALNGLFLPKVMKMVVDKTSDNTITTLLIRVGRIQLYIIGYIIIALFIFGRDFLRLWVGTNFNMAYYGMLIVLFPCLFHLTMGIAEELIFARNKVKYRALIYVTGSVISVLLIVLLSPKFGAIGASIAIGIAFLIAYNILADMIYYRVLKLGIGRFFKETHLKILPVFIIILIFGFTLQYFFPTFNFIMLGIKGIILTIVYFALAWVMSMNQEEKNLIKSFVSRKHA